MALVKALINWVCKIQGRDHGSKPCVEKSALQDRLQGWLCAPFSIALLHFRVPGFTRKINNQTFMTGKQLKGRAPRQYNMANVMAACVMLASASSVYGEEAMSGNYDCLLEPSMEVKVSSAVPGVIETVAVDRGDLVKKGQVLVILKSSVERASVDLIRARAEFTQRKANRFKDLYSKNLISVHEKDEILTEARVATMELKEVEETLKLRTVVSPIKGIVTERSNSEGEYVGYKPIMTLVSVDPLNVEVIMPVDQFGLIQKGMTAKVYPDAPVGSGYLAKVIVVDKVIDAASGTFGVRLELPNPEHKIPAGMNCMVRFPKNLDAQDLAVKETSDK